MSVLLAVLSFAVAGTGGAAPTPVVFPQGSGVPLNVHFLVLEPASAEDVRLIEEDGTPVPARIGRAGGSLAALEVVPVGLLESEHVYCVELALRPDRSVTWRSCARTGTSKDEQAPIGGAPRAITVAGGELRLEIDPGEDASDVAMELEVRRPWRRACRDLAIGLGAELRHGRTVDLYGIGPGTGTSCFPFVLESTPRVRMRIRWRDPAGHVGPWSEVWELPAGADPRQPQVFRQR